MNLDPLRMTNIDWKLSFQALSDRVYFSSTEGISLDGTKNQYTLADVTHTQNMKCG